MNNRSQRLVVSMRQLLYHNVTHEGMIPIEHSGKKPLHAGTAASHGVTFFLSKPSVPGSRYKNYGMYHKGGVTDLTGWSLVPVYCRRT